MRNIDLYKTPAEADEAFQRFCDSRHYDANTGVCGCPYENIDGRCEFYWAMAEVDDSI